VPEFEGMLKNVVMRYLNELSGYLSGGNEAIYENPK
jgi:hypothetical protein